MPLTKSPILKVPREAMIRIPLASLRYLSSDRKKKKIVCEISTKDLTRLNPSVTIDEMIAEAKLEYVMGKTKSFSDPEKLLAYLNS